MGLRHTGGLDNDVVKLLLLCELDNLGDEIGLQRAADAAVLHSHHGLVTLDEAGLVDEALVNVDLRHVVDDDGALEFLLVMLCLQDVLQEGGLARAQEPAEQSHGNKVVSIRCLEGEMICQAKKL